MTHDEHPIGVIDLGSNSLRLAIFASADRAMVPLYNEKEICQIGRGLESSGNLYKPGTRLALQTLERFKLLAESRGIKNIHILATEAVRRAQDGRAFVEEIRLRTGLTPIFLTGEEEAKYAAAGLRFGIMDAQGAMGDLGGGSLELAQVGQKEERLASLPLGPLRLSEASDGKMATAERLTNEALRSVDWTASMHKKTFYAVGGAWRAVARAYIRAQNHPLDVIHLYNVDAAHLGDYAARVAAMSPEAVGRLKGVSKKRRDHMAMASLVLERVIAFGRPERVCFSATGLREGYLFSQLPEDQQRQDPLLHYTAKGVEAGKLPEALPDWVAKVMKEQPRLRTAACHMSNKEWGGHPEYRAKQAYQHCLALPVGGIDHQDRCFMALALYVRHAGESHKSQNSEAIALLPPEQVEQAIALGCVLRLAYGLSGGMASPLQGTSLKLEGGELVLTLNVKREGLLNDTVERRLAAAAAALKATPRIVTAGRA